MSDVGVRARVRREREAHGADDVLARSYRLKGWFNHVVASPTMRRFEADFAAEVGEVRGKRVLDLGCGRGEQSLALLRDGARVVGVDLSEQYAASAEAACAQAGYDGPSAGFCAADAHALCFPAECFDVVIGRGILHHTDIPRVLMEVRRVLRPGGLALFQEPLAGNPLLRIFRFLTPGARTRDEKPLSAADLREMESAWSMHCCYYGLVSAPVAVGTSILLRPFPDNLLLRWADRLEQVLNRGAGVRPFNQYVLIRLTRP